MLKYRKEAMNQSNEEFELNQKATLRYPTLEMQIISFLELQKLFGVEK